MAVKAADTPESYNKWGAYAADSQEGKILIKFHRDARKAIREGKKHSPRFGLQPAGPAVADLTYDDGLAKSAAKYASECIYFEHSHWAGIGENIYSAGPRGKALKMDFVKVTTGVKGWIAEGLYYNYSPRGPKLQCTDHENHCGHYTQLINENVKKFGCAWANCFKDGFGYFAQFFCHYDFLQKGNDYPYKEGPPNFGAAPKKEAPKKELPSLTAPKKKKTKDEEKEEARKKREAEKEEEERQKREKKRKYEEKMAALRKEKQKGKSLETKKKALPGKPGKPGNARFVDFGTHYDLNDYYDDYGYFDSYDDGYYVDRSAGDTQKAYDYVVDPNYDAVGVGEYYPHSGTDNEWMVSVSLMVNIGLFMLLLGAICCICVMVYGYLLHKLCKSKEDMVRKSCRMSEV